MITPTSRSCRPRSASRIRRAERSLSSGSSAAWPRSTFERSMPALAHTKPCLVSLMMRSPRRRRIRTDSARRAACGSGVGGVDLDQHVLGLRHDLLGHDEDVAAATAPRRGDHAGDVIAGRTSGSPSMGMISSFMASPGARIVRHSAAADVAVAHDRVGDHGHPFQCFDGWASAASASSTTSVRRVGVERGHADDRGSRPSSA